MHSSPSWLRYMLKYVDNSGQFLRLTSLASINILLRSETAVKKGGGGGGENNKKEKKRKALRDFYV